MLFTPTDQFSLSKIGIAAQAHVEAVIFRHVFAETRLSLAASNKKFFRLKQFSGKHKSATRSMSKMTRIRE